MKHYDRHRAIAEASIIRWNGLEDTYSADLWAQVLSAQVELGRDIPAMHYPVWFGGARHMVALTQLEDLTEAISASFDAINQAKTAPVTA